jgi:hypothetical protein
MNQSTFLKTSGIIFLVVALVHLWRAIAGIDLTIGSTMVPMWLSWVVVLVLGYLSYQGLRNR